MEKTKKAPIIIIRRRMKNEEIWSSSVSLFLASKNHGNLKTSTECLVEKQPGLELGDERKP